MQCYQPVTLSALAKDEYLSHRDLVAACLGYAASVSAELYAFPSVIGRVDLAVAGCRGPGQRTHYEHANCGRVVIAISNNSA
jgi:hypothetical protein